MSIIIKETTQNAFKFLGKVINSPEQRLLQGVVAIGIQPLIDFKNKTVDDDTRAVSVARTIGKIIAGTAVGVAVRYASIGAIKLFSNYDIIASGNMISGIVKKSKKDIFTPMINKFAKNLTADELNVLYSNYTKTVGTALATVAMVFTNFLIDAPLTKAITNKMTPKIKTKIEKEKQGGKNVNNQAS